MLFKHLEIQTIKTQVLPNDIRVDYFSITIPFLARDRILDPNLKYIMLATTQHGDYSNQHVNKSINVNERSIKGKSIIISEKRS